MTSLHNTVRVKDIAKFLDVKMPSVNAALKILKEKGLINHEAYGHVELTEKGKDEAREVYKRHRLILSFIQEILGVPYEVADEDACRVEHVLSEETIDNLAAFMMYLRQNDDQCPEWLEDFHASIRQKRKSVKSEGFIEKDYMNLTRASEGRKFLIKGIDGGQNVKKKLAVLGLIPDTLATIVSNQGGHLILEIKGARIALGAGLASKVWGKTR